MQGFTAINGHYSAYKLEVIWTYLNLGRAFFFKGSDKVLFTC